jgi:hypothetical protein
VAFVAVERRVEAPLVDLRLLKNRVLIGATVGILLSKGVINGLMYLLSLYFQNPGTLAYGAAAASHAHTVPVEGQSQCERSKQSRVRRRRS